MLIVREKNAILYISQALVAPYWYRSPISNLRKKLSELGFQKGSRRVSRIVPEGFQKPFQKEFQKGPRRSSRRVPEGSQKDSRRRSRRVPEASQKEFQKGPRRVPEGSQKGSYGLLGHTRLKRSFQACFLHFAIFPTSSCFWWPCSGVSFRLRGAFCG